MVPSAQSDILLPWHQLVAASSAAADAGAAASPPAGNSGASSVNATSLGAMRALDARTTASNVSAELLLHECGGGANTAVSGPRCVFTAA